MGSYGKCDICGTELEFCEFKEVGGASYNILKCGKCKRNIIRGS